jgi:hypothetical protein
MLMNELFFPVVVKSKRQWARPDRPGNWGQRRDGAGGGREGGLRRMKSEGAMRYGQEESGGNGWGSNAGVGNPNNGGRRDSYREPERESESRGGDWRRQSYQPSSNGPAWK